MRNNAHFGGKKSFSPRPNNNRRRAGGPKKQYINPERFINKQTVESKSAPYTPKHMFADFDINALLLQNIAELGYEAPSAIQDQTIPLAIEGKDVIGLANTGTGKTAAFLLPILTELAKTRAFNSVLIMAPTRELAQQIDEEFKRYSRGMKLFSALCVGGMNINHQIRALQRRPHVVIGTPGRLKDLIGRNQLHLYDVKTLVLDEADRMLDMGFVADIREIASQLPLDRQTLCFSATMTRAVEQIVNDFMKNPEFVSVKVNETNDHIYQDIIEFDNDDHKKELLHDMLSTSEFEKVVVFGETKFGVQRLADLLSKNGLRATAIHGNKSQPQRERALKEFKSERVKVLVATDVAARGLDIPDVSHVINFDQPQSYDDYVHRIGRTGRGGKSGTALTFVKKMSKRY
jgi:superfamily II DNA/RNA helicase